jgi:hypothetical protein
MFRELTSLPDEDADEPEMSPVVFQPELQAIVDRVSLEQQVENRKHPRKSELKGQSKLPH